MTKARYTLSEGTDLNAVGIKLRSAYTRRSPNEQRLDFFDLYDYFVKHASSEQQVALLVFELELIEQTYKTLSPEERAGRIYNTGSQVYTELHKLIGEISVDERLILINQLRHFIDNKLAIEAVQSKTWPNLDKLVADIDQVTLHIVKVKEKNRISRLLHTMPDLIALKNNIKEIYGSYKSAAAGRYFENIKREGTLAFIDYVGTTCDEIYGTSYRDNNREENEKDAAYMEAYNAHRGMILFALLQIKDEYRLLTPKRSALFRECLSAAGYESLDDITIDEKVDWLRALSKHLDEVRRIKSRTKSYDELIEQWQARKMPEISGLKHEIEEKIFQLEEQKKQPSFLVSTAKSATASAAAYAFQRTAVSYVAEYAIVPTVTAALAGAVAGPVGLLIGGVVGPFVANRIGRLVSEKLIPAAVGNLCATLLDRIGSKLGDAAAAAAFAMFSVSKNGVQRLLGYYKENINDNFEEQWINTLLELPDSNISAKDKQKIRKICGLPDPLPSSLTARNPKSTTLAPLKLFDDYKGEKSIELVPAIATNLLY